MARNVATLFRTFPRRVAKGLKWVLTPEELELLPHEKAVKGSRRRTEILAWLFATEDLAEEEAPAEGVRRRGSLLRYIFSSESLGVEAPLETPRPARGGLVRYLLSRETLGEEPEAEEDAPETQGAVQGPVKWLLSREKLPEDAPQEQGVFPRRSLVRYIFSAEELDELEEEPPPSRRPFIPWLFSRELLEDEAGCGDERGPGDA